MLYKGTLNLEFTGMKLGATYDMGIDYKKNETYLNATLSQDSKQFIEGYAVMKGEDIYLSSKQIFDKVLKTTNKDMSLQDMIPMDESGADEKYFDNIEYIVKTYKDMLLKNMNKDNFTHEKTKIDVDDKNNTAVKSTYTLTKEDQKTLADAIYNDTINDEKLLNALLDIEKETDENATLETLKEELKTEHKEADFSNSETIVFNLFTSGSKVLGLDMLYGDKHVFRVYTLSTGEFEITYAEETTDYDNEYNEITTLIEDKYKISGTKQNDKMVIKVSALAGEDYQDQGTFTINKLEKEEIDVDFVLNNQTGYEDYNGFIKIVSAEKDKNVTSKINLDLYSDKSLLIKVESDNEVEMNATLSTPSITGAVDVDSITNEETITMLNNFNTAIDGTIFETLFTLLMQ